MSEDPIKGLDQILSAIEENTTIQKEILTEVNKTTNIYSQVLTQLKRQNEILEKLRTTGKLVTVS